MASVRRFFADKELSDRERKNFAILDTIRQRGPIARTEISKLTGFNIVTVTNYVDHYIKQGLVSEEGYDTSSGGRKPMLVNINQKSTYVIGVGFTMAGVIGLLSDLRGEIVAQIRKKHPVQAGLPLIEELMNVAKKLVDKVGDEKNKIKGIGFGISGVIDRENRTIKWPGILGTKEDRVVSISLWDEFTNEFDIPVVIENDADCAAFGEQWLALNPDYKNVIYMYSGVSCGIMIHGQIYKGASDCAGELGIWNPGALDKYDWKQESFNLGRWDMELGMLYNMKELYKEHPESKIFKLANNKPDDVSFVIIVEAANAGDELAIKLLAEGGMHLGKKVAFLVNLFNPQVVVIGGGIEKAGSFLMSPLKQTVKDWAFEEASRVLKIIPAQLGENAVSLGASSLVIKSYFERL